MGRRIGRAAVVVRSVKLVHQGIEQARRTRSLGQCSRLRAVPIDLSTMLPMGSRHLTGTWYLPGAGSITRWFTVRYLFVEKGVMVTARTALAPSA